MEKYTAGIIPEPQAEECIYPGVYPVFGKQAVTCPVCGGNGLVDEGFYRQTSGEWSSAGGTKKCRSCFGFGYIVI